MVMYALWKWRCGLAQISLQHTPRKTRSASKSSNGRSGRSGRTSPKEEDEQNRQALIDGEYNAVQALLRILPQGIKSKRWCDHVLDVLSHMQNLRKAVYQMQMRGAKAVNEKSKKVCMHRAEHYLQRYCLLIAYTSYLLHDYKPPNVLVDGGGDDADDGVKGSEPKKEQRVSFAGWLKARAAVKNCIYSATLG